MKVLQATAAIVAGSLIGVAVHAVTLQPTVTTQDLQPTVCGVDLQPASGGIKVD